MRTLPCALMLALVMATSAAALSRPFVFVVDSLNGIAKIDTSNFSVSCRTGNLTGSNVIWGISGPSNGSRIYAGVSNGTILVIDGNTCGLIQTVTLGTLCANPDAVAVFPNGNRLLVVCGGGSLLYLDATTFGVIDSIASWGCGVPSGYDLEFTPGPVADLTVACQGTGGGLRSAQANGTTLSNGPTIPTACGAFVRDVALQNSANGCNFGTYVCEQDSTNVAEFLNRGCVGQTRCTDSSRPHAVAHVLNGGHHAWVVDDAGLKVFEPDAGSCVFVTANLSNFKTAMVETNPSTGDTAFVVGSDQCNNGAIAEVDRNGVVLRSQSSLNFSPRSPSADGMFVAIMG